MCGSQVRDDLQSTRQLLGEEVKNCEHLTKENKHLKNEIRRLVDTVDSLKAAAEGSSATAAEDSTETVPPPQVAQVSTQCHLPVRHLTEYNDRPCYLTPALERVLALTLTGGGRAGSSSQRSRQLRGVEKHRLGGWGYDHHMNIMTNFH